jgi:acyl-coenzyme A synthetase/AMP-(fatty) acid ligase
MAEIRLLHELLWRAAEAWPGRVALEEEGGGSITYDELAALADAAGEALRRLGVRRGDRVAVCVPKSIDAVAAIFAAMKVGAAYLPLDPGARPSEPRDRQECSGERGRASADPPIRSESRVGVRGRSTAGRATVCGPAGPSNQPPARADAVDVHDRVLYTSGSTGRRRA